MGKIYNKPTTQTEKKTRSTFRCTLLLLLTILTIGLNAQVPNLNWATTHVNTSGVNTEGWEVAVDNNGNSIIVGTAFGTGLLDFNSSITNDDINLNSYFNPITFFSGADGYVAKYDPNGTCLWSIHIPPIGTSTVESCRVLRVSCDAMNNVYVLGQFWGTIDCDPGPSLATYTALNGSSDLFVAKYDANGNHVFSFPLASQSDDNPAGIVCAANNSFHVVFTTWGGNIDLDPGPGTYSVMMAGTTGVDMVMANYNASGTLNWGSRVGGTGNTLAYEICTNANSDLIVTGANSGGTIDFDPGPSTSLYSTHTNCLYNAFVAKYSNTGLFNWVAHFNNTVQLTAKHWGESVASDPSGNIYVSGHLGGITDIDPSTAVYTLNPTGAGNVFLASYNPSGNLNWGHTICSSTSMETGALSVDNSGMICMGGSFSGNVDMDPGPLTQMLSSSPGNVYLSKYNASNGSFVFSEKFGGSSPRLNCIKYSNTNNLHVLGTLKGTMDFDLTAGTNTLSAITQFFLAKYSGISSSVGEFTNNETSFNLYPNPTGNSVSILIPDLNGNDTKHLDIYNTLGELILQKNTKEKITEIDLSQQPAGIYFIRIDSVTKKIIKE